MAKLKLIAEPTFRAKVPIPVAGGADVEVEMTFRHRTRSQFVDFNAKRADRSDIDAVMDMVTAWELEEPFDRDNVNQMLEIYGGAAIAIYRTYAAELLGARIKN